MSFIWNCKLCIYRIWLVHTMLALYQSCSGCVPSSLPLFWLDGMLWRWWKPNSPLSINKVFLNSDSGCGFYSPLLNLIKIKPTFLAEFTHESRFAVTQTGLFVAGASIHTVGTGRLTLEPPESIRAVCGASNTSTSSFISGWNTRNSAAL